MHSKEGCSSTVKVSNFHSLQRRLHNDHYEQSKGSRGLNSKIEEDKGKMKVVQYTVDIKLLYGLTARSKYIQRMTENPHNRFTCVLLLRVFDVEVGAWVSWNSVFR